MRRGPADGGRDESGRSSPHGSCGELAVADLRFRVWQAKYRVAHQDFGSEHITHPTVGELTLDWDTFRYTGAPEQQLVLGPAAPGTSDAERLADSARGTSQSP
ncbi:hypothetical protein ACIG3E_23905 [Streptomyces sp. NPDC053474]|uniref:MmyB family transcriptional regulator n=1 Tax=Streptomyces sp. NPDC053474 TaxID=3365704 RepID=UPI0037D7A5F7